MSTITSLAPDLLDAPPNVATTTAGVVLPAHSGDEAGMLQRPDPSRKGDAAPLPPKPANTRYDSLDLWRGAACIMLVLYHATFYGEYHFRIGDTSTWTWAGLPLYV